MTKRIDMTRERREALPDLVKHARKLHECGVITPKEAGELSRALAAFP